MTAHTVATTRSALDPATIRRPGIGVALLVIGVVHVLVTPLLYGDGLRSILDAGVFASIDENPAFADLRSATFWYVTAGLGMIAFGVMVGWTERRIGTVPYALGWLLVVLATWGIVLMPVSPFWAFLVVAGFAFRSARRAAAASTSQVTAAAR